jgi:hypothetical protein
MASQPTLAKPHATVAVDRSARVDWPRRSLRALATPTGFAWLGFILSLIFLFCQLSSSSPAVLKMWLSSDTLYPVNVFTDTFIDGYSLSGWQFSIAPCWFPDLVLVGLFLGLTQNVILATLLAGFIQIALIVGAFVLVRKAVRTTKPVAQDVLLLAAGVAITIFVAIRPGVYYPGLYQFFLPQTHVGSLCVVLYGLGLALLCVRRTYEAKAISWGLILLYAVVCILGGMSNLLFMVQMLAPLTVSLGFSIVFNLLPLRVSFLPLGIGWSAAAMGAVLNRVLFNTTAVGAQSAINYERVMTSLDVFMRGFVAKVLACDGLHMVAIVWAIVCILYVTSVLRIAVKDSVRQLSLSQRMTMLFFLSCFVSAICSAGAIVLGGSNGLSEFKDYTWSMHYLHPAFLVPLFGLPLALSWSGLLEHRSLARSVPIFVGLCAFVVPAYCIARTPVPARPIQAYVPPLVRFIDDLAAREGLRCGFGGYWQTRLVTLLSKTGVRAYPVDGSLRPLLWVSNRQWYSQRFNDRRKQPTVDFVILDDPLWKISRERVVQVLGEPKREVRFENTRILIYVKGSTGS